MSTKKVEYSLDEIAEDHDIVLIDSSICEAGDSLTKKLYNCHEELDINIDDLKARIESLGQIIAVLSGNNNIHTIKEVVDESKEYKDIINSQVAFHYRNIRRKGKTKTKKYTTEDIDKNIAKIHFQRRKGKRRNVQRKNRPNKYEHIEEEKEALNYLSIYAGQIFVLNYTLSNRVMLFDDSLVKTVIARAEEKELKRDFSFRYNRFYSKNKPKIDRYTDEKVAVAAYELASQGKDVGIISNDSDLKRIFRSCFEKDGPFKLSQEGCIHLYSDYDFHHKYTLEFNTIHLL